MAECSGQLQAWPEVDHYWLACKHRGGVVATINSRVAGCDCSGSTVDVYHCKHFNEPVIKQGKPPCLDTLREQVPGATGRTCCECPVPNLATDGQADILYVTPTPNWQSLIPRGQFAMAANGIGLTCLELTKPGAAKLAEAIAQQRPRLVFIHALSLEAEHVISLAEASPAVQFVVVLHSQENHAYTWPAFFAEIKAILGAAQRLPNLWFSGAEECKHWVDLGYRHVRRFWQPCEIENHYAAPPTVDPPLLMITSRPDIVKALPAQLIAAAIVQRQRNVRVAVALNGGDAKQTALRTLAETAGLSYESWPWLEHAAFLHRLCEDVSIVLQPSMSETFNYVSWEAGSVGRPWVGSLAIRHTPAAWRADPNNPADIARVACEILDGYQAASRQSRLIAENVAAEHNAGYAADVRELLGL